jgi:hypothetical protein
MNIESTIYKIVRKFFVEYINNNFVNFRDILPSNRIYHVLYETALAFEHQPPPVQIDVEELFELSFVALQGSRYFGGYVEVLDDGFVLEG